LAPEFGELRRAWEGGDLSPAAAERLAPMAMRTCFYVYGQLALAKGDAARALAVADDLLAFMPNARYYGLGTVPYIALLRAEALTKLGRLAEAADLLQEALVATGQRGARIILWRIHLALGRNLRAHGRRRQAGAHFASARALIEELALTIPDEALRATFLQNAAALLPPPRPPSRRAAQRQQFGGLTARERDVAVRVAQGLSNREIALALVLSERTIEGHVTNILSKLALASRTQIAAWAHENGLVSTDRAGPP
jgi:DNA-binding CsgD family transcriptional regulator